MFMIYEQTHDNFSNVNHKTLSLQVTASAAACLQACLLPAAAALAVHKHQNGRKFLQRLLKKVRRYILTGRYSMLQQGTWAANSKYKMQTK